MQLKIEYLPIDELKAYEKNTRKHEMYDVSQIAKSIEKYGFNDAVGIWGDDNTIVEGHGRVMAAKKLGMTEVPCVRLDHLTDEERKEYGIIHNKSAELSDWDFELLAEELKDLDLSDFDIDWGLSTPEEEEEIVEDEPPEAPAEPITQKGDIYLLGEHRLICGDSTNLDDITALCNGEKVDLYLTDPPYNVDYTGKTKDALKIENDHKDDAGFRQFLVDAFSAASAVMKAGASFYIWHADSEGYNFRGACHDIGWKVRECLIWVKNVMVMGRQDYQWKHEPVLYGWQEGGSHAWYSDRRQTTVLEFDRPTRNKEHPTMKPVALFDYLIKNSSKPGDIVLDSFGGSGTSIIACEQDGRRCFTCELDPKYCDVIVNRYINLVGDDNVYLIRNGEKTKFTLEAKNETEN